ncbi:protein of unknown function (plasmid) [Rhodovastum atsumiense]|nr:protein of unknown function [Rhodovastum atsumiense]
MSESGQPIWSMLPEPQRRAVLRLLAQITLRRGQMMTVMEEPHDARGRSCVEERVCLGQDPAAAP